MHSVGVSMLCFAGGVFAWSFLEYALHNWVGHWANGGNHFSREHLTHHSTPRYFTPTAQKVLAATVVGGGALVLVGWFTSWWIGGGFATGLVAAYTGYELLHYRIHVSAPRTRYTRWAARHHFSHHFASMKKNHGVTSPLWDHVFGTHHAHSKLTVPQHLAMPWLLGPDTGSVVAEFEDHYQLRP